MINKIYEHFEKEYPKEGCGIIGVVKGKKQWFPCNNIYEGLNNFIIDSTQYFKIKSKADIVAIVHNHIETDNTPSTNDINSCNALGIPYYIFKYPEMDLNIVQPKFLQNPLIGREYEFGVTDCFEAAKDFLASQNIDIAPRAAFEDRWYEKDLNYFTDEIIAQWGAVPVSDFQKNDILIFQLGAKVPDHCGVFLGRDVFFHHARNRLSCRENLYPFWIKHLVGAYRYDENSLS